MKAEAVKLGNLNTPEEHMDAIKSIEEDYRNCIGGLKAWTSGHETALTKAAENKIQKIWERFERLFPTDGK